VDAESAPGQGATFTVRLPAHGIATPIASDADALSPVR
jgi:hypothetical protein